MTYDPSWDMPLPNWGPHASFENPQAPPDVDPDAGTPVCIGPIAWEWVPFILGALDQLRNPSSWSVADDDALYIALNRANRIRQIVSLASPCVTFDLRLTAGCALQKTVDGGVTWVDVDGWDANFTECVSAIAESLPKTLVRFTSGCNLQESFDGGTTWSAVPGWDDFFGLCVQANAPITSPPPFPVPVPIDDEACANAGYITTAVLEPSLQKAIDGYLAGQSYLDLALQIVLLLPGFDMTALFIEAVGVIYTAITSMTIGDFEAAMTDSGLWFEVQCAIYAAILADGHLTEANFPTVLANVAAISYAHAEVISAIHDYMQALGFAGVNQLAQPAGIGPVGDCSSCGAGWCYQWDFRVSDGGWASDLGPGRGHYVGGVGWQTQPSVSDGEQILRIHIGIPNAPVTYVEAMIDMASAGGGAVRHFNYYTGGVLVHSTNLDGGAFVAPIIQDEFRSSTMSEFEIQFGSAPVGAAADTILWARLKGTGANPFGDNNCTPLE